MRSSSLANNPLAITRELDGRYDVVLQVRDNLDLIEQVAGVDFAAILAELESAQDFTGITVVQGETVAWDAVNKILTVPKGDKGDKGDTGNTGLTGPQGIQGPQGIKGDTGLKGDTGSQGPKGFDGAAGAQGLKGDTGDDLTITQITYNGNGTFNWLFSDGTTYVTPDLRGPKGDTGDQGIKGDQGISVHHIKGTSTTDGEGDFATYGEIDTYTVYADADETINLGFFRVNNGAAKEDQYGLMYKSTYDTNSNGVVDNSERLGGQLPEYYVNTANNQNIGGDKTFTGNVTVQGDLVVNGSSVTVNAQTVEVEDNLMLINKGEVGNGVTAGEAGILVDRGTAPDYKFVWEEAGQAFKIGEVGSLQKVATREDNPISEGIAIWDNVTSKFNTTLDVKVDSLQLNGGVGVEGTISWNIVEGTADLQMPGGSTLQIGQENVRLVRNSTASLIANGTVCMFAGTIGNSGRIKVKPFTGGFNEAMYVYGVATQDIAAGVDGLITIEGKVRGIDTTGAGVGETWLDEDILYAKPGDSGRLTKVMPSVTELRMPMASVIKAHTHGTLEIRFTPINENQFEPRNANIQTHIASTSNPHSVTKTQVGLGNVDNTSDADKPISMSTQSVLDLKAPIANPTFTGVVSGVTKVMVELGNVDNTADNVKNVLSATKWTTSRTLSLSGDATGSVSFDGSANVDVVVTVGNDTHTHAFGNITGKPTTLSGYGITDADTSAQVTTKINNAVAALVDASPTTLDTLNELAAALGDDPNFATTTSTALGNRVVKNADIVAGTGTKVTYDAKGLVTSSTTPTTLAGYSIGDAYTKTEVNNLLALKVDDTDVASVNLFRADKYLSAQAVANMVYDVNGKLSKVQYNNATDVEYEVLTYDGSNKLSNVAHYIGSVLKGNTVLNYSSGKLVSAPFTAV